MRLILVSVEGNTVINLLPSLKLQYFSLKKKKLYQNEVHRNLRFSACVRTPISSCISTQENTGACVNMATKLRLV